MSETTYRALVMIYENPALRAVALIVLIAVLIAFVPYVAESIRGGANQDATPGEEHEEKGDER